ncbi:hypothetical protein ACIRU3_47010 [Streptomyces sp. NPDC101151]|uniref:hypothetical protein n=1 Tax=Streptomyces sp. NPDC101151 TaxID=3366115 RepID=UPI00382FF821
MEYVFTLDALKEDDVSPGTPVTIGVCDDEFDVRLTPQSFAALQAFLAQLTRTRPAGPVGDVGPPGQFL